MTESGIGGGSLIVQCHFKNLFSFIENNMKYSQDTQTISGTWMIFITTYVFVLFRLMFAKKNQ